MQEDEIVGGVRKGRVAKQSLADLEDYTPTPSPRKVKVSAPKQPKHNPLAAPHGSSSGSPKPSGGPKGQKEGGPCAVCFVTKSATWRRGALGGRHSGEPLCNKCGVWEFRHPDSPPRDEAMDLDRPNLGRRGSTGSAAIKRPAGNSRGLLHQHDEARALPHQPQPRAFSHQPQLARAGSHQLSADSLPESSSIARSASVQFSPAAVAAAAPAVGPFSRMQPWAGNNLVARVPDTVQLSTMQRWAAGTSMLRASSGPAASPLTDRVDATAAASPATAAPPATAAAHAANKKRSADGSNAEPEAKRWQTEASTSSSSRNMWAIANAARLSHASKKADEGEREDGKGASGLMGLQGQQTRIKLKVVRSCTAAEQEPRVKEEF